MRCQEQTEEKLLLLCLFNDSNDSKTSAYVMYCPQGIDNIILNADTGSIWEETVVVCCR
jgi:hypothetical protein